MIQEWERQQRWWGARGMAGLGCASLRSTKDGPGKAQPQFPHCHEGTGFDKARLRSCIDLSSERVRDRNSWWETQRGPPVTPQGSAGTPSTSRGGGHPWVGESRESGVPRVAVTQEQEDPWMRGEQGWEPRDGGNQEMMGTKR